MDILKKCGYIARNFTVILAGAQSGSIKGDGCKHRRTTRKNNVRLHTGRDKTKTSVDVFIFYSFVMGIIDAFPMPSSINDDKLTLTQRLIQK